MTNLEKIVNAIQGSNTDQTIKDILIKDLYQDGLTDFLFEQIETMCGINLEKLLK